MGALEWHEWAQKAAAERQRAVAAEREACAQINDHMADIHERDALKASENGQYELAADLRSTAYQIRDLANAIRARANQPEPDQEQE